MTDTMRDRLLDRCGLPRDCGWTDDQLFDHIDLGLRHNAPTPAADGSARAKRDAAVRDIGWALNCHGLDVLAGMADDILARYAIRVVESLASAHLDQYAREVPPESDPGAPA